MAKELRDIEVYLVYVDSARCDGCAECARYCPVGVFDVAEDKATPARPQHCLGCRTCAAVCPSEAVVITEI